MNAVRYMVRFAGLLVLVELIQPWVSFTGTIEARYADVMLRLGQADTSATSAGVSREQRLKSLAFEARWQAASLLLFRSLGLCLRQAMQAEGPAVMQSISLPAATSLVRTEAGEVVRSPSDLLKAYRMPRVRAAQIPRGCEAFAACIESVGTYGNRALELASKSPAPEISLREAVAGLDRALERTARAVASLRLRLGPVTDSTEWVTQIQGETLMERWRIADSLERVLLIEAGARPAEVASYAEWIERGLLPFECTECSAPEFWTGAGEVLHSYARSDPRVLGDASADARPDEALRWNEPTSPNAEPEVEWFDALGRKVWTGVGRPRIGQNWNAPERTLPRGVYFVRDPRVGFSRIRRVVVLE